MPVASPSRQALVTLSANALRANLRLFQKQLNPGTQILAVVKADAYGHGAVSAAAILSQKGIENFGVATLEEGLQLRQAGIKGEILVLGPVAPEYIITAAKKGITLTGWSLAYLRIAEKAAQAAGKSLKLHLKMDTGMHRLGFSEDEIVPLLAGVKKRRWPSLRFDGAYTHFSSDGKTQKTILAPLQKFLNYDWPEGMFLHACNSATALNVPQAQLSLVRPGIFLYGAMDSSVHPLAAKQQPVMSLSAPVVRIHHVGKGEGVSYGPKWKASKKTRVAVLALGYADGLPRYLSGKGRVLINGRYCPLIGTICMDLVMADITKAGQVEEGAPAVFIGKQGKLSISVHEWASLGKTISYEILSRLSSRVPRVWR